MSFAVEAAGSGLGYQWRKGGLNIAGAAGSSLTLNNVTASDGSYDVVLSGTCGVLTSSIAALDLNDLVTTTAPADQQVYPGAVASFTTVASGGEPFTFEWKHGGVTVPVGGKYAINTDGASAP